MEKKKLKLSISGSTNKTINSIEQAKNQSKNTVVIEKKPKRFLGKPQLQDLFRIMIDLRINHNHQKNLQTILDLCKILVLTLRKEN